MKTLIVCYSQTGSNVVLAEELQERLDADLLRIKEVSRRNYWKILLDLIFYRMPRLQSFETELTAYEHFVLVGPVWFGKIASPIRSFIDQNYPYINTYSFLGISGSGDNPTLENELRHLAHQPPLIFSELAINDLLPPEQKDQPKYLAARKLTVDDLPFFEPKLQAFLQKLKTPKTKIPQ